MSGQGTIRLPFGNDEYDFNVAHHKQLFELQDKCGTPATGADGEQMLIPAGLMEIFNRLRGQRWRACDVREPIRLGLVGGGLEVKEANRLMRDFAGDGAPLGPLAPLAARIVFAAAFGVQGDELGKDAAGRTTSEGDSSSSAPRNTAPAPPSDSPRDRSTT